MTVAEQAFAFTRMMRENKWTQSRLSKKIGVSQGTISNILKFFNLTEDIQVELAFNRISSGLAFQIAAYPKNTQTKMLQICQRRESDIGKTLHPNEAARVMRQAADRLGIAPKRKNKGRKSTAQLNLTALRKNGDNFLDELEGIIGMDPNTADTAETFQKVLSYLDDMSAAIIKADTAIRKKLEKTK